MSEISCNISEYWLEYAEINMLKQTTTASGELRQSAAPAAAAAEGVSGCGDDAV